MQFSCPHCQTHYKVSRERLANRILKVRCKVCQNVLAVRDPQLKAVDRTAAYVGMGLGGGADPHVLAAATAAQIHQHWYYAQDGYRHGPIPLDQLREEIAVGNVGRRAWLWCPAFETWVHASEVEALQVDLERASLRSTAVSTPDPVAAPSVGLPPSRVGKFRTNPTMSAVAPVRNAVIRSDRLIRAEFDQPAGDAAPVPAGAGPGEAPDDDIDFALPSEPTEIVDRELHRQLLREADLATDGWSPDLPRAGTGGVMGVLERSETNEQPAAADQADKQPILGLQEVVARHPEPGQRGQEDSDEIDLGDLWGEDEPFGAPPDLGDLQLPEVPEPPVWTEPVPSADSDGAHLSVDYVSEGSDDGAQTDLEDPMDAHHLGQANSGNTLPAAEQDPAAPGQSVEDVPHPGDLDDVDPVVEHVVSDGVDTDLANDEVSQAQLELEEAPPLTRTVLPEPEPVPAMDSPPAAPAELESEVDVERDGDAVPVAPAAGDLPDDFTVMDASVDTRWLAHDDAQIAPLPQHSDGGTEPERDDAESAPFESDTDASESGEPSSPAVDTPQKVVARSRQDTDIQDILDTTAVREFDAVFGKERDDDDFVVKLAREADATKRTRRGLADPTPDVLADDLPIGDTKAIVSSDEEHAFFAELKGDMDPTGIPAEPDAGEIRESKQMLKTLAAEIKASQPEIAEPRLHAHEDSTVHRLETAKKRKIAIFVAIGLLVVGAIVLWIAMRSSADNMAPQPMGESTDAQIGAIARPVYEIPKKQGQADIDDPETGASVHQEEHVLTLDPIDPTESDESVDDVGGAAAKKGTKKSGGGGQKNPPGQQSATTNEITKLDAAQLAALNQDRAEVVVAGGGSQGKNKDPGLGVVVDDRLIGEMFNKRSREMIRCAEKGRVVGKLMISFGVAITGAVENIQVTSPDAPIPKEAQQCVRDVVARWKFPEQAKPFQFQRVLMISP